MERTMGRWNDIIGPRVFRTRKAPDLDLSDMEAQTNSFMARIDKMQAVVDEATVNGEEGWFLCLTKRKEVCDGDGS